MAIDTAAKRYSAMNVMCPWRHVGVLPTGTIDAAARQAARWFYSGILAAGGVTINFVADLNTRLAVYLAAYYGQPSINDLATYADRYMESEVTGDGTQRFQQLIVDATEAMS